MAASNKVDVLQQLRDGITQLTNSATWLRYLDVQRRFHNYSWGNCLLISMQRPDATRVAGYHQWQKLGRQVNVGERAIKILAPVVYKKPVEEASATDPEEIRVLRAFRPVSVFDVSQTSGEPLPQIATRLLGDQPVNALRNLEMVAGELDFRVILASLPGARNGECNFSEGVIRIRNDLEPAHMVKTLAHEIGARTLAFSE